MDLEVVHEMEHRGWVKKGRQAQNYHKKRINYLLLLWNMLKIFMNWALYVAEISNWLDQIVDFSLLILYHPGSRWKNSNQILFWSGVVRFCTSPLKSK